MSLDKIVPTANCMFDTIKNTNILEKMKDKKAFNEWLNCLVTMNRMMIDEWTTAEGKDKEELIRQTETLFSLAITKKLLNEIAEHGKEEAF